MKADVIKIGNSKGIRLPASILKQCGIDKKVEIEIRHNNIILRPVKQPREGWSAAFKEMSKRGDDQLLIPEIDVEILEEWDK
ncbi:AbrB/MazE/SpoVT family DNA-binding domain-containing protein [Sporomusa acidovorans]|uniref:SpoVT-AbrB domain-containing protein n=1 Tax=Sporomusa acidovorans (strain ATCC 49682 / DSM 3132 / Mol) TaxID=1123286 RepID=A0ABZ3IWI2_SPOA4|nr:AbrB/MazE/SpoVT family DNA-binding domain-containing protein [Sporomusa acidovorans]OZC23884.1 SpoVT / AbrB like domain protein [Sporomusa acidovorans DSM 3132]SDF54478.1 transcriptional regulator/antitoxin, MazE [Sporomusa acidovorans]